MRALGLMSGTSMDGVDAAILDTDGERIFGFGPSGFRPYSAEERAVLAAAQGLWPDANSNALMAAREIIQYAHVEAALEGAEIAGFHGQTLIHDPAGFRTHQLGDGAALARALGIPVVWDMRSADMAAQGQGAPLAPVFHHACARWAGLTGPVCFLNLGGVGNLTWCDAANADPAHLIAFDTGPANALLDDFLMRRRGDAMDRDGALALSGRAGRLPDDPYFDAPPPKSLDRNGFRAVAALADSLGDADGAATLTAFTVHAVERALPHLPEPPQRWLVCGGGRKNPAIMAGLRDRLGVPVDPVEVIGLDGDMLEAQAFAYLAVRISAGLPTSYPGTTGCAAPVCGGRISAPG
ncbi:anhydro-N-acetylmuramic acid kinase [Pontivivens insulae]|uniref:Anhydro-N-acetylmuramic acid kinase n=1 Tax=Pontivivens insulae TaxID=1639689 RepID=A0A2R8ABV6_9RHOB|nr:anhydro-N-acetylmuramic acid kinase [Pontivivens insulae]RED11121.1 anhydro-N-acetylmuramic acid kinase [Pontivivens insulae]SPF29704.1 Anhydro-N-acetylmuramic acid kinase [Pontivivens insulae]